jgi:hypothetical protein
METPGLTKALPNACASKLAIATSGMVQVVMDLR